MKHIYILNFIEFDVESDPSKVSYTQSTPDNIHTYVYDSSKGRDVNTLHNQFVKNTLIAETRFHIPTAMTPSIEKLYAVLGCEQDYEKRSSINMDKFSIRK